MQNRSFPWPTDSETFTAWQAQLRAATQTPWLWREFLQHRHALLPRFAILYQRLRALPRRVRRVLQRKWACSLAGAALLLTLQPEPSWAHKFTAGTAADLINAITTANSTTKAD